MKKEDVLKYIEDKGDSSFIVRTEAEETVFLENHAKRVEETRVRSKIGEHLHNIDDNIYNVTGLKRKTHDDKGTELLHEQKEKTEDFIKRVLTDLKTKSEKASAFEIEIASLKQQIKDGTGDKKTLADLESMQKQFKLLEDTKTKEITDLKTEYDKFKVKAEITSAISGMIFKKNIPESALKALTDQIINDLTNIATHQDGKLVFLENGVPMRNAHNALNPYTAKELLEERMKDIRDVNRKADGGPDLNKEIIKEYDKGKLTKIAMIIPDAIKYKDQLSAHLVSAGLLRGTEDYNLAYKEYSPSLEAR